MLAVLGTQIMATLIAVYGVFMTPLGWGWAAFVWAYAIAWFLVSDRVKLFAYRVFDPTGAPMLGRAPVESRPVDVNALITQRAFELYVKRGRQEGHATEDWLQAEREIRKDLAGR